MGLKESIENHPVIWWLATLGVGFGAGLAAYHAGLDISDSAVVSTGRLAALESQALTPNGGGASPPVPGGEASHSGSRDIGARESTASEASTQERSDEATSAGRSTNAPPPGAPPSDATPPDATVRNGMELVSSRC